MVRLSLILQSSWKYKATSCSLKGKLNGPSVKLKVDRSWRKLLKAEVVTPAAVVFA